jgi:hypothetical protein
VASFASGVCSGIAASVCGDAQRVVWWGAPGLVATILSATVFYYGFLPPVFSLVAKTGQMPRFAVFVASAVLVGSLSAAQRRVAEKLRRAHDELDRTVHELKNTNEALGKSEAYLAEAQTLSHTGSFGLDVATGELVWSDETFRIFEYDRAIKPTVPLVIERIHPRRCRAGARSFHYADPERQQCGFGAPFANARRFSQDGSGFSARATANKLVGFCRGSDGHHRDEECV